MFHFSQDFNAVRSGYWSRQAQPCHHPAKILDSPVVSRLSLIQAFGCIVDRVLLRKIVLHFLYNAFGYGVTTTPSLGIHLQEILVLI